MKSTLDASALLAFLQGETGADAVEGALEAGSICAAVNWSEVAQKVIARDRDWVAARALLETYGVVVEPVVAGDAEWAARRWRRGEGLSLADRLCLAVGARTGTAVLTADARWGSDDSVRQIR